jgi:transposase-like protein
MKRSVKKYDAQLKAKLALELVSGKKTLIEICTEHKIPKTTLIEWKEKLEKESHDIFLPISERDKRLKQLQNMIQDLHKIIGEITIENNFLKKKLQK